jgi:DNA invertase Pin-like site-specific DNA recombinase
LVVKMKTAAIYARVSTEKQDSSLQVSTLKDYAARWGLEVGEVYSDDGVSGAKDRRPELDRLMADARRRKVDAVLVFKFDRFARSTTHLLRALEEFRALGIDFISYSEGIDTTTPVGKMVFTMVAAIAEFERELIRERVKAGIERARRQGKQLGRRRLQVSVEEAAAMKAGGKSLRQIAGVLGCGKSTVATVLRRAAQGVPKSA